MGERRHRAVSFAIASGCLAIVLMGLAGSAAAKLTGPFEAFSQCPYTNTEVRRCVQSTTTGGEVVLGSKAVPIVNPVVLQGGYGPVGEDEFATEFFAAKNGETLTKAPQPVPGGLAGLVNCKKISEPLLRLSCEATLENGVTGVNSTLELAGPASSIRISENHLAEEFGTALEIPVKFHLENPFLGSSCYVGSNSSPVIWKLTTGTTEPPPPNEPIKGRAGEVELLEEGSVLELNNSELVDNSWSAPGVNGCGGALSLVLDPIIDASAGLPSGAGHNTAILVNKVFEAPRFAVNLNDEENP